jgi:hypothetical protein
MRKRKTTAKGKWVFVPHDLLSAEEQEEIKMDDVCAMLSLGRTPDHPFAAAEEFQDYFPGDNKVPDGGGWILVKTPPPTEYTVPPLSIWFAEPWPMDCERHSSHRVKIITPKGELGLFPREYSLIRDPSKYYEFVGQGMEIRFFGNEEGVPKDALFYLRSRGISKRDALCMLIAEIKAHGVMWIETDRKVAETFCRHFPDESRLATV